MIKAGPHVPESVMRKWREAIRKGDDEALKRLVNDLMEPVNNGVKHYEDKKYGDT